MHRALPIVNKTYPVCAKRLIVNSDVRCIDSKRYVGSFLGRFVFSNNDDKYFDRKVPEKQKKDVREKKVKEITRVVKANDIIKGVNDDENAVSEKEKIEKEDPKYFPNLVERKIREAIQNGEFKNLPYNGKPMPGIYEEKSSWVDPTEEWCYSMLKRNGFAPEWVELNKTIHEEIRQARRRLEQEFERVTIDPVPVVSPEDTKRSLLSIFRLNIFSRKPKEASSNPRKLTFEEKENVWRSAITSFEISIKIINDKIFTYNLMVPMSRQLFQYSLQEEIDKITNGRDPIAETHAEVEKIAI